MHVPGVSVIMIDTEIRSDVPHPSPSPNSNVIWEVFAVQDYKWLHRFSSRRTQVAYRSMRVLRTHDNGPDGIFCVIGIKSDLENHALE